MEKKEELSEVGGFLKAEVFKIGLEDLSGTALEISGIKSEYTDRQLSDAMLVLMEVFMNKMHDFHANKLSTKQMMELAEECGKSFRQTTLLFTGVDLHKVHKTDDQTT